ncbi:MAG: beta-aspartyl-peptidase [Acidaminococcaceae bacterium]
MFTLLQKAHVVSPEELGLQDILLCGEKIAAIEETIEIPAGWNIQVINLEGKTVIPGFIDSHIHLIGGGGEGGPATRTPEVLLSKVTGCGVTTVIGLLGTDGNTRHMESLLAKARGLEDEGISTFIYAGAYQVPTPTITGSVRSDIILIDKIIGAGEIAISDHRSAQPTREDLQKLLAEARVGGMLSGKAGIVDFHMGDGERGLNDLKYVIENTEIPYTQCVPTHVNRNQKLFDQALAWAKEGGYMDITSGISPASGSAQAVKPSKALRMAIDSGVPLNRILMSSDGNGSVPVFDEQGNTIGVGVANQKSMLAEIRDAVFEENIVISDAVQVVSTNVARAYKLKNKGKIEVGFDADLVVLDNDLSIQQVWAKGQLMVEKGEPIVFGTFEKI